MAYSKGTGKPFSPTTKRTTANRARIGTRAPIPSDGNQMHITVPVTRKPARNKARVAP